MQDVKQAVQSATASGSGKPKPPKRSFGDLVKAASEEQKSPSPPATPTKLPVGYRPLPGMKGAGALAVLVVSVRHNAPSLCLWLLRCC